MRYLNFGRYSQIGGTLDYPSFERTVDRACGLIDSYTSNRLNGTSSVSARVQACVRDLCECLNENSNKSGKIVKSRSQSAGGVSESENYEVKTAEQVNDEIRNIIYDYLSSEVDDNGVPLLYRGCMN